MIGYRQTLLVFLLMMLSGATIAQNNTNSPYTRYGYGQLADQGSGNSKAMGDRHLRHATYPLLRVGLKLSLAASHLAFPSPSS